MHANSQIELVEVPNRNINQLSMLLSNWSQQTSDKFLNNNVEKARREPR